MVRQFFFLAAWLLLAVGLPVAAAAQAAIHNDNYNLCITADGAVTIRAAGMTPQRFIPQFTVLWNETDPGCSRSFTHPNYAIAPRNAVRWRNADEPLGALNTWLGSPEFKSATGWSGTVRPEGTGRVWEFKDAKGRVALRLTGKAALETTRPFTVGHRSTLRPIRTQTQTDRIRWQYETQPAFDLTAEMVLPPGAGDPVLMYTLTPRIEAFFSVAFTGAPEAPLAEALAIPQECDGRGHKQFGFVMCEADLHLPRVHVATATGNIALVVDPRECSFRLPAFADSRFGAMLAFENGCLKPVLIAPLLGGAESRMRAGRPWSFAMRCVARPGDWKQTYAHIARAIYGFHDQRDNSGAGPLDATLERVMDFLADRRGGNFAMWDEQQKYYDYFTDKTGVFKPFSPLYGLAAAIVTDDADFFRRRALPAVEYALSRRNNLFAPYDNADNKQANSAVRKVGAPYIGYAQLLSLHELFGCRSPVLLSLAKAARPARPTLADALARWRLTGDPAALAEARSLGAKVAAGNAAMREEEFFDLLDLADATRDPRDPRDVRAAVEAAYDDASKLNLFPVPPDARVTVDRGGWAPVHAHSIGRHRNIWGFPPPQPLRVPEQTVPAWRIARLGVPSPAYPMEYWMNTHGALMRTAELGRDGLLRDIARWGMVGRFGNYPGDNRSQDSLVAELPDAVERRPWQWNFATVNPGHAWDFAGAVLDFLVSDAFERSRGAIDFPALSAVGSLFRVRIYGGKPGRFYDDEGVRLWLPKGLVTLDNRQIDWLAGYGNGNFYLALWNQSFKEERTALTISEAFVVPGAAGKIRLWRDNQSAAPLQMDHQRLNVTLSPQGILALAIPAQVKPRLQAQLYDSASPALGPHSFTNVDSPFGMVHAMLLRAGRGLTSAYVYTEALPEKVIAARLRWRRGGGPWQELADDIYPYEFSLPLRDAGGDFAAVLEIEDARQNILRSPVMVLSLGDGQPAPPATPPEKPFPPLATDIPASVEKSIPPLNDDFVAYLQRAANEHDFGRRADGRYYPYSTPQGRRIAWRQPALDKALYARGCTREEAERHLRAELAVAQAKIAATLSARKPAVNFTTLDLRQREILLDFSWTEGTIPSGVLEAVLARDWPRLIADHLYIRYAGHAPDHPRNKAFMQRWGGIY